MQEYLEFFLKAAAVIVMLTGGLVVVIATWRSKSGEVWKDVATGHEKQLEIERARCKEIDDENKDLREQVHANKSEIEKLKTATDLSKLMEQVATQTQMLMDMSRNIIKAAEILERLSGETFDDPHKRRPS